MVNVYEPVKFEGGWGQGREMCYKGRGEGHTYTAGGKEGVGGLKYL